MKNRPFKNRTIKIDDLHIYFNNWNVTVKATKESDIPSEYLYFLFAEGSPEYEEIRDTVNQMDLPKLSKEEKRRGKLSLEEIESEFLENRHN